MLDHDLPQAHLATLKAKAMFAMSHLLEFMPSYDESELLVVHRANAAGARRTEVWTNKEFAPGALMFGPWTHEIKERLYTTGLSVHLALPREAVPGGRALALDGRNRNHLCHANARCHIPNAVGNLFWAIARTQDRAIANLTLEWCSITAPGGGLQITLPMGHGQHKVKLNKDDLPKVPVLINKKKVHGMTMLVALDDDVIVRAKEDDKAAKETAKSEVERKNKKARTE